MAEIPAISVTHLGWLCLPEIGGISVSLATSKRLLRKTRDFGPRRGRNRGYFARSRRAAKERRSKKRKANPRANGQTGGSGEIEQRVDDVEEPLLLDETPETWKPCGAGRRRRRAARSRCAPPARSAAWWRAAARAAARTSGETWKPLREGAAGRAGKPRNCSAGRCAGRNTRAPRRRARWKWGMEGTSGPPPIPRTL